MFVADEFVTGNFLGLPNDPEDPDIVVLQVPYELTTSYGQGTAEGPAACIAASCQVELFDIALREDLPAGYRMLTAEAWDGSGNTLKQQLANITTYLQKWHDGKTFPIILGGEHGMLPAIISSLESHPHVSGDFSRLTVVQIDAHADLREQLGGERYSHACAAARAMDFGLHHLIQIGVRAFSKNEFERIESDNKITTYYAHSVLKNDAVWQDCIAKLRAIKGPIHLTIDIDGLDGSLVSATGTPVPGGLTFWQAVDLIEAVFSAPKGRVISMDVNEIVPQRDTPLTEFTAASLATKALANHILVRKSGRW